MPYANRESLDIVTGINDDFTIGIASDTISMKEYSRFKHGDGDAAEGFGAMLADSFADNHTDIAGKRIFVTSSAYRVAPPASNALVEPFVARLSEHFSDATVDTFKINRTILTQGDYASMPLAQREEVMKKNGLVIPEGVDIAAADVVIALDDILVTGSHEQSIEKLFDRSGVEADRYYAYILRVGEGIDDPRIEAAINHCAVKSLYDVITIARVANRFIPNARLAKMVASSTNNEIEYFTQEIGDIETLETIGEYVDELEKMAVYAEGHRVFHNYLQQQRKK